MKKNLVILALLCVGGVLALALWFKEDLKKDSLTIVTKPAVSQTDKVKTSTKVESKTTKAPVVPRSKVDEKLEKLGFGQSIDVHKIIVQ